MQGLNLSRWAVSRPTLILFLMLVIGLGGLMSYQKLGRAEDPSFTIKVAIVTAFWPGATAKETRDQVADLLEKKLQELPFLDKIETYTKPGFHGDIRDLQGHDAAARRARTVLSTAQEAA